MIKEPLSNDEIIYLKKKYNKELLKSLFIVPFFLFLFLLPLYLIIYCLSIWLFNNHLEFFYEFTLFILFITVLNFLYGKFIICSRIENGKILKITEDFEVIKKEEKSTTSSDIINDYGSNYYIIFLKNNNSEKKIDIEKRYYDIIDLNELITISYFDQINIPIKGIYNGHQIKLNSFSKVRKYKILDFTMKKR